MPQTLTPSMPASVDEPIRVMLIEDSLPERLRLTTLLQRLGHSPAVASNGQEALNLLAEQRHDVIISDWQMPEMDGLTLCREIKQACPSPPYFIMLTGRREQADLIAGMDAGADDFIGKPVSHEELRVRLQAGVRSETLRRQLELKNRTLAAALDREQASLGRLERDLAAASRLQRSMLPRPPRANDALQHAWLFQPAEKVGGDALGLNAAADGHSSFFLLDVCGHGIAAAMQSVGLCQRLAPALGGNPMIMESDGRFAEPATVMQRLNILQCTEHAQEQLFTMAYGTINHASGHLQLCLGGHPRALLWRSEGRIEWLGRPCLPLGVVEDAQYHTMTCQLGHEDVLLLYSDGLIEQDGPGRACLEQSEALATYLQAGRPSDADTLIKLLRAWLDRSHGDDDISALALSLNSRA